jgi:hypothetical protein
MHNIYHFFDPPFAFTSFMILVLDCTLSAKECRIFSSVISIRPGKDLEDV